MTFDEKLTAIVERVSAFMRIYTAPKSMSDEDQVNAVISIAQSIARKVAPSDIGALNDILNKTFEAVADHHESYAWPPQAIFIKHLSYRPEPTGFSVYNEERSLEIAAGRMSRGEPVGDRFVFGACSTHMARSVGHNVVEDYRKAFGASFRDIYRENAAEMIAARYGEWAAKYV